MPYSLRIQSALQDVDEDAFIIELFTVSCDSLNWPGRFFFGLWTPRPYAFKFIFVFFYILSACVRVFVPNVHPQFNNTTRRTSSLLYFIIKRLILLSLWNTTCPMHRSGIHYESSLAITLAAL